MKLFERKSFITVVSCRMSVDLENCGRYARRKCGEIEGKIGSQFPWQFLAWQNYDRVTFVRKREILQHYRLVYERFRHWIDNAAKLTTGNFNYSVFV